MLDALLPLLSRLLVPLFLLGMAGASVVVAITVVHDVLDCFDDEDAAAAAPGSNRS